MDLTSQDRDLMIRTIIGEAGDQSDAGQSAVAHVILNRATAGNFGGDNPSSVVLAPGQFEPWQTRAASLRAIDPNSAPYQRAAAIVDAAAKGAPDPTGGATYFLNPNIVRQRRGGTLPGWASGPSVTIGQHTFYGMPKNSAAATSDDLLGSWGAGPSTPATAAAAPAASAGGDDLLGAWGAATSAPNQPQHIVVHALPQNGALPAAAADQETPGQAAARLLRENQGGSFGQTLARFGVGAFRGVGDVADTLAQGITYAGDQGANALLRTGVISPQTAQSVHDWRAGVLNSIASDQSAYRAAETPGLNAADFGRIGGNIVGSGPFVEAAGAGLVPAAMRGALALRAAPAGAGLATRFAIGGGNALRAGVSGAATGAMTSALTSSASDAPLSDQTIAGGLIGGILGPAGYGASRLASRAFGGGINQETARLADTARNTYGIPVGPGQISANPMVRFADSVLQRLPFTGYGSRSANQQGAFNRAISNTFGEDTPSVTHDTIANARQRIGDMFDSVAARTGDINVDPPFVHALQQVHADARQVLPTGEVTAIENQIRSVISTVDRSNNTMSARSYQALTRKGAPLDRALQSSDPNIRFYAGQIREALDDAMQRSAPPDVVQDLIQARSQWKALKTVEPLVKKSTTGDISPANLLNRVATSYQGAGGALGDLGRVGRRFLTEPPSSGTAERNLLLQHLVPGAVGLTGLSSLGAATYFDPDSWQRNALLGIGTLGLTRGASAALRSQVLANAMIQRSLAMGAPRTSNALVHYLPAAGGVLMNRQAPPALPPPQ